jgi:hypothetical protein
MISFEMAGGTLDRLGVGGFRAMLFEMVGRGWNGWGVGGAMWFEKWT